MDKNNSTDKREKGLKMQIIEKEKGFYPNTEIHGSVMLIDEELKVDEIYLQLKMIEYWTDDKKDVIENTLIHDIKLNINSSSSIDFTFLIPENLEPSFEYISGKYKAHIRYFLEAKCSSEDILYICSYIILIKAKYINKLSNLKFETHTPISRLYSQKGVCDTQIYIDKDYLTLDNNSMDLNIQINNENCEYDICKIKATIQRIVYLTSLDKEKLYSDKTINNRIKKDVNIKKGSNSNENLKINFNKDEHFNLNKWKNPYEEEKIDNFLNLVSSVDSMFIKCIYTLKVTIYFNAYFVGKEHRPRIIIPFFFGQQSKEEYEANLKKLKKKSLFDSDLFISDFQSINKNFEDYIDENNNQDII